MASYAEVCYTNVYPGADLIIRSNDNQVEYDFVVAPGCDPTVICIEYQNVISLALNADGDLEIETEFGTMIEKRPIAYQSGAAKSGAAAQ